MFEFVILVVLANLTMLGCLYVLRHFIAIRAPVLFMAVGISIVLCVLYPFLAVLIPYPQIFYLYAALVLAGAALLSAIESKFMAAEESRRNQNSSPAPGDVLAAVGGVTAVDTGADTFHVFGRACLNQTRDSNGSIPSGEPAPVLHDQADGLTVCKIPLEKPGREELAAAADTPGEDVPAAGIKVEPEEMAPQYPSGDWAPESAAYDEAGPPAGEPGGSTIPEQTGSGMGDMPTGIDFIAAGPGEQGGAEVAGPEEAGAVDEWAVEPARLFEWPAEPGGDSSARPEDCAVDVEAVVEKPAGAIDAWTVEPARLFEWPAEQEGDTEARPEDWAGGVEAVAEELAFTIDEAPGEPVGTSGGRPARGSTSPGGMAEGSGNVAPAEGEDIGSLVARSFDALGAGDKFKALEGFFTALKLNPEPRLAAMICFKISSIYLSEERRVQALAVMEMLQDVWGPVLDEKDLERVKTILIQLRREAK